jgi:hypothetical protein
MRPKSPEEPGRARKSPEELRRAGRAQKNPEEPGNARKSPGEPVRAQDSQNPGHPGRAHADYPTRNSIFSDIIAGSSVVRKIITHRCSKRTCDNTPVQSQKPSENQV